MMVHEGDLIIQKNYAGLISYFEDQDVEQPER
jgi:preprotein translocase subunit Sec61beta